MNGKQRIRLVLLAALAAALLLGGCNVALGTQYQESELTTYANEAGGYQLQLPESWQLEEETTTDTLFYDPDQGSYLRIIAELGGYSYYTLEEVAALLQEHVVEQGYQVEVIGTKLNTGQLHQAWRLQDAAGSSVLWLQIAEPYPPIRYYLLFQLSEEAYRQKSVNCQQIAASFALTLDEKALYALMQEYKDAANEAARLELEQELERQLQELEQEEGGAQSPPENEEEAN